jgi:hypothetical protein
MPLVHYLETINALGPLLGNYLSWNIDLKLEIYIHYHNLNRYRNEKQHFYKYFFKLCQLLFSLNICCVNKFVGNHWFRQAAFSGSDKRQLLVRKSGIYWFWLLEITGSDKRQLLVRTSGIYWFRQAVTTGSDDRKSLVQTSGNYWFGQAAFTGSDDRISQAQTSSNFWFR